MVRVLKTGYDAPMRALEFGANGIMVPHCRSAEEARQWVDWVRFPPLESAASTAPERMRIGDLQIRASI